MDQTYTQQPALSIEIPQGAVLSTETTEGFFRMREWQTRCFDQLTASRDWIINAPMAAGKSFEICAIAAERLNRDEHLRVIIAVPQTIIGAGFESNKIEYPDGTRVVWEIQPSHDLCRETRTKSSAHLLNFLEGATSRDPMSRVILCSHATLVRAFAKNKEAFSQVLLVFYDQNAIHFAIGNWITNVLPCPGPALSAHARPPCLFATERTMYSPSPVPLTRVAIGP